MRLLEKRDRLRGTRRILGIPGVALMVGFALAGCGDDNTTVSPPAVTVEAPPASDVTINQPTPVPVATLTAIISGRVVDSSSGRAIAGVSVSANVPGVLATATTDAQGAFAIQNIPRTEGNPNVILTVTGAGAAYPSASNAVVGLVRDATVSGVEPLVTIAGVEIELHELGGTISGEIRDATGRPVQGAAVTVDAVQIPLFPSPGLPGTVEPGPATGVLPFTLTAANSRGTTDANGVFTISGVPEDWIYNVVIISGTGSDIPNITLTNQYLPSGSSLRIPDLTGAPGDFTAAGPGAPPASFAAPTINGVTPAMIMGGTVPPGLAVAPLNGGPLALLPGVTPGGPRDTIRPFVLASSQIVDGTFIAVADNAAGRSFSFTMSEPLGNSDADLANGLRLIFAPGAAPFAGTLAGTTVPVSVSVNAQRTTVTLTPQVFDALGAAIPLPAGVYAISQLATLRDVAGNVYNGSTPGNSCPMAMMNSDCDAANQVGGENAAGGQDNQIDFVVLGNTTAPPPPSVASIVCADCQRGNTTFMVGFDTAMDAVQYVGAFATMADDTFTSVFPGPVPVAGTQAFLSIGPLADPPEVITFDFSINPAGAPAAGCVAAPGAPCDFNLAGPSFLVGFTYPLIVGTETNATPVFNNYFDDGIQYQIGVQALNRQGILGPQNSQNLGDVTAPGLFTTPAVVLGGVGTGNDINNTLGVGVVAVALNMTTTHLLLENFFANSTAGDMTAETVLLTEGAASTVGYDFMAVIDLTPAATDGALVYSAMDYATIIGTGVPGTVAIRANEDIIQGDPTMALVLPTVTSVRTAGLPGFTNMGGLFSTGAQNAAMFDSGLNGIISAITLPADTDMIADEDLIGLTFGDVRDFVTGDLISLDGTGITDEAMNPLMATVRVGNAIPAAIISAIARTAANGTHELELQFDRPVFLDTAAAAGLVNAAGLLTTDLGLANAGTATLVGATPTVDMTGLMLTLMGGVGSALDPTASPALTQVSTMTTINGTDAVTGMGLVTNDPLNFNGLGNVAVGLPVNMFAGGLANILVVDQIFPRIVVPVTDMAGGTPNLLAASPVLPIPGNWQVGDVVGEVFTVIVTFSENVFSGADAAARLASARSRLSFSVMGNPALAVGVRPMYVAPLAADIVEAPAANQVRLMFTLAAGSPPVAEGDVLRITVQDLAGNNLDVNADTVVLRASTLGVNIQ